MSLLSLAPTELMSAPKDYRERYQLSIGASTNVFDTDIRIDSRDGSISREIDLEEDLGFDNEVKLTWITAYWRVAERHRLRLIYTPIRRSTYLESSKDIDVGDRTIKAGASLSSDVKTHLFDIQYEYSFYKRPGTEAGITGGIYWMNSVTSIHARGEVEIEETGNELFVESYEKSQRLVVPLPSIGLSVSHWLTDSWEVEATARLLDVTINNVDGYLAQLKFDTSYFFSDRIGVGLSLNSFDLRVTQQRVILSNSVQYRYTGVLGYLTLRY